MCNKVTPRKETAQKAEDTRENFQPIHRRAILTFQVLKISFFKFTQRH
jgi:hypothetical protein